MKFSIFSSLFFFRIKGLGIEQIMSSGTTTANKVLETKPPSIVTDFEFVSDDSKPDLDDNPNLGPENVVFKLPIRIPPDEMQQR